MKKIRIFLYSSAAFIVLIILIWYFSIPAGLIEEKIKENISRSAGADIHAEITGLKKGPFFTVHFDRIDIYEGKIHAVSITDLSVRLSPAHLYKGILGFTLNGKMGRGSIYGSLRMPASGTLYAKDVELSAIPYLSSLGISSSGSLSAETVLNGSSSETRFSIDKLELEGPLLKAVPLINSFRRVQGLIKRDGNTITITSLNFDGEKGYARLKGKIKNGFMDVTLEFMPEFGKLDAFENILIRKYESSPGYYIIPYRGRLPI